MQGENCNCTAEDLSALASGQQALQAASLDGVSIDPSAVGAASTASSKGFLHAQAGPYALFTLVGLAAGVMLTIAANFVWSTFAKRNSTLGRDTGKFQPFDSASVRG